MNTANPYFSDEPTLAGAAHTGWSDAHLLGYAPMDHVHSEFFELLAALRTAPDPDFIDRFSELHQHCITHFESEERWMSETGFPPRQCHKDEHDAVLKSLAEVADLLKKGRPPMLYRNIADALRGWFDGHAAYMDSALSTWMSKQRYGGAPVVLRRTMHGGSDA